MTQNSENPLVSVIIPTYNRDWVLKEALDCHYLFSDCFGLLSPVDTQRHIALSF